MNSRTVNVNGFDSSFTATTLDVALSGSVMDATARCGMPLARVIQQAIRLAHDPQVQAAHPVATATIHARVERQRSSRRLHSQRLKAQASSWR